MTRQARNDSLDVQVKAFGPTAPDLERLAGELSRNPGIRKALGRGKSRLLGVTAIDTIEGDRKSARPRAPQRFRADFYDYASSRAVIVEGPLSRPSEITITESAEQPPVTVEEFDQAVAMVAEQLNLGQALADNELTAYRPMPPLLDVQEDDGTTRRVVTVGLYRSAERRPQEILGVDLSNGQLHRFDERGPAGANPASNSICGAPVGAGQPTASKGTAGQAWVTVRQSGQTIWRFLVVRPAASSGTRGSGIELRFLDYRGKRVLYRAHVPILNVKYDRDQGGGGCGPFRDWQWEEGQISADGRDVAPGFRLCSSPAQTIMQTGSDAGNFLGVGIYVDGQEVVLVSEMEAGWYRYVSEWRLHTNGTVRPRFGFAATDSPCVCNIHHHHAYWRLDFDIVSASGNRVEEYNNPPLAGRSNWHQKQYEISRARDPARQRKWRVKNIASGAGYEIRPRSEDGVAAQRPDWPYGRGDVWILRYRGTEIDDGVNVTYAPSGTEARIGKWLNGEPIDGQDVVIWYGGHFTHDASHDEPATHGHILGPDLVPFNW